MPPRKSPSAPQDPAPPLPAPAGDLPHLPGAWIGAEVFEAVADELAEAERFFCTFDLAPERCPRRACQENAACRAAGKAGEIHRECRGRPGAHVRGWVLGLWLSRLAAVVRREGDAAVEAPAPRQKRRRGEPAPHSLGE